MSSILDLEADISSDESDVDYVPPTHVVSDSSGGEEDSLDDDDKDAAEKPKSRKGKGTLKKTKDPEPEKTPEPVVDEKQRAESLYKDFLSDVSTPPPRRPEISESKVVPETNGKSAAGKAPSNTEQSSVAELFEFAGETFTVKDGVCSPVTESVKEAVNETSGKDETRKTPLMPKRRGGLESVLGAIASKKKKLTTLEKTQFDWQIFKKTENLEEDLANYNRGKNGFIERQRFLENCDVRSFEAEKAARLSKRKM